MANWTTLKMAIANVIKTNGNQEITGQLLQNVLNSVVSSVGANATFAGIATPVTNPGVPDGPVFYLATEQGTYSNFGGISIEDIGFAILYNGASDKWTATIYKELNLYNKAKEVGTLTGIGVESGQIAFYWSSVYIKKGYKGQLRFSSTGPVKNISCYVTTNKGNLNGGYSVIEKAYGGLSQGNNHIINFIAPQDGYIMVNTAAPSDVQITCEFYTDLSEEIDSLSEEINSLSEEINSLSEEVASQNVEATIRTYSLTGNNSEGDPTGVKRNFNFTSLELTKGVQYKFNIKYANMDEIGSLSFYTTNVQGTLNYGHIAVVAFSATGNNFSPEFTFTPSVNGYLMLNLGATVNGSVAVTVSRTAKSSNIYTNAVETGTLTGSNADTTYGRITFKHFRQKLYAGKKYQIRLVQNLINNVINTEFKSLSCYVEYMQGTLGGGYETVFIAKTSFNNNEIIEYTPTKNGYLMLNTGATTNKTFYITVYTQEVLDSSVEGLESRVEDLESSIDGLESRVEDLESSIDGLESRVEDLEDKSSDSLTIKQKAKTVTSNAVGIFPIIKPQFKDVYLTLCGDSIFALQSTFTKDDKGVAAVPPTCDKKANANMLWNALGWGNPQYRRFDYGKNSLVGDWDDTWPDDSNAMFTETGAFKTEYIGQTRREDSNFAGEIGINMMQVSTKIDEASFPYQFDNSEDSWWQRNIPKRFSNSANASVKFTIPAGYSKFDFLYHAHIYGDSVAITIDRGDGAVKVNTVPNDFSGSGSKEANNSVFDLSMTNLTEPGGGNDAYGIPNMRLYFNILDTSLPTTVTITKTSDTSKYLIYWGITYWGTSELPYALHINNMAIGGYGQRNIYNLRSAMFKFVPSNAIILEMCYNSLAGENFPRRIASMDEYMSKLKVYFESLGKNINTDVGVWLPHCGQQGYRDYPDTVKCNYAGAEKLAIDKGYKVILNLDKICNDVHDTYYSDMSMSDFMNSLGNNGVHLDIQGQWIYSAAWESLT